MDEKEFERGNNFFTLNLLLAAEQQQVEIIPVYLHNGPGNLQKFSLIGGLGLGTSTFVGCRFSRG